ncbi:MAG: hypothetical protein IJU98_11305 [Synergistaceae bacterium]|nr:hypothetical protein [Synergistaceae bacterium]
MKRLWCFTALLALTLCAGIGFAADEQYIVLDVEGQGRNRSAAIEDAWMEGIRQAVGSFIDAKTELNDDQLTERIIAYSRGLVEKYEITGVDDSRAAEGVYKLKMRVWVARDLLKDGVNYATGEGTEIAFSVEDIKAREKEALDAKAAKELESRNAKEKTGQDKAKKGAELLSATLERYKPEDFLTYRIAGKPEPVKGKEDIFSVPIEITFNEKLYYEKFLPDLEKVLDQISAKKKNTTLIKQKKELRDLKGGKALAPAEGSVVLRGANLGADYSVAVYDKPDRFGCNLYGFADAMDVSEALGEFGARLSCVSGFKLELQDEDKEAIYDVDRKINLSLLLSNNDRGWAFHPTLLSGKGRTEESAKVTVPFEFEMPVELQELVKSLKASLILISPEQLATNKKMEREREREKRETMAKELGGLVLDSRNGKIIITEVLVPSPAANAGIRKDDILVQINGLEPQKIEETLSFAQGNSLVLMIEREGATFIVSMLKKDN